MSNTDPVSGLMASMARVRNRRPDGLAAQAGTASQASTVLPVVKPVSAMPAVQPPTPSSFEQVLPAPQNAPQTASTAPQSPVLPASELSVEPDAPSVAEQILARDPEMDISDAYLLGLGYLTGVGQ